MFVSTLFNKTSEQFQGVPRTSARTHNARTRPRKVTYSSKQAEHSRRNILGGLTLPTLSSDERRRRRAPFLTVLGTHCISRSFPLPSQRMSASPAAASAAPGPAAHAHPAASKRPCNQTPHVPAARCVGVPAAARPPASHAGRGDTLEAPCCLTGYPQPPEANDASHGRTSSWP